MRRKREILKILLCVLTAVFIMVSAAALLLVGLRTSAQKEQKKQEALEALENRPTVAPTLAVSVTPSPTPRPRQRLHRFRQWWLPLIRMISGMNGTVQTEL